MPRRARPRPPRLFDTELAGRLLGYPQVGLGAIVEEVLGLALEKGHSAADWSTRPLPEPWLRYAALDVEVLVELRDALADELDEQGKRGWAERGVRRDRRGTPAAAAGRPVAPYVGHAPRPQAPPARRRARAVGAPRRGGPPPRHLAWPDPARHRDRRGRPRRSRGPSEDLVALPVWGGRSMRRQAGVAPRDHRGAGAAGADLPDLKTPHDGPPPARSWATGNPRPRPGWPPRARPSPRSPTSTACRSRTCSPPTPSAGCAGRRPATAGRGAVADVLRAHGARPWQVELTASVLADPIAGARVPEPPGSRRPGVAPPAHLVDRRRSGGGHPLVGRIWQRRCCVSRRPSA